MNDEELLTQIDYLVEVLYSATQKLSCGWRTKPIFGGVFGHAEYVLASALSSHLNLHRVTFLVVHEKTCAAISIGDTKVSALAAARELLSSSQVGYLTRKLWSLHAAREAANHSACLETQIALRRVAAIPRAKVIPRRRRAIFDESQGKCHYCETTLVIDGKWHVEHKMPKALGGTNAPGNLVAACPTCNHEKLDKTDLEYIYLRSQRGSVLRSA